MSPNTAADRPRLVRSYRVERRDGRAVVVVRVRRPGETQAQPRPRAPQTPAAPEPPSRHRAALPPGARRPR